MACKPLCRMEPPPRSFAADAHDCIMVPILTDRPNTRLWRDLRARWRAPLGLCRTASTDCETTHVDRRRTYKIEIVCTSRQRHCDSVCAFAVKPRAFGAPHAAYMSGALSSPISVGA